MFDAKFSEIIKSASLHVGHTKIKYNRNDLVILNFGKDVNVAGVYTKSSIVSPTIDWCRKITSKGKARAIIINSGNANTMTGNHGVKVIENVSDALAQALNCSKDKILINSTGVIGEPLPYDKIISAIPLALNNDSSINDAAKAIMTTDLVSKVSHRVCKIANKDINIIAFAKGSGMCAPNMATMLAYVITDADIPSVILHDLLKESVDKSLNCVSVDSDSSTNDSALFFASASILHDKITDYNSNLLDDFKVKLNDLMIEIAKKIAADGEGATKLIEIEVKNADNFADANKIARSIAESPLVKTAIFGNDPNWGRIAMAIGKTGIMIDQEKLIISIGEYQVFADGLNKMDINLENKLFDYFKSNNEVNISVDLNLNKETKSAVFYSCDFSENYIKINAEYRS
ncbi:MAG: bifunctional glutamate N-acetyltransferase/amino-acid acetyltransferase ArgJ [Rickettsiales bacterium]|nr:bifunctional glutamate N-acetyltransferase/amino-acid acetyltransferase ArgJ [Rickettsiales bacterium]